MKEKFFFLKKKSFREKPWSSILQSVSQTNTCVAPKTHYPKAKKVFWFKSEPQVLTHLFETRRSTNGSRPLMCINTAGLIKRRLLVHGKWRISGVVTKGEQALLLPKTMLNW